MYSIRETSPDPAKIWQDPDPGLYGLQRTSETISMKTKNTALRLSKIFILKNFDYLLSFEVQSPRSEIG